MVISSLLSPSITVFDFDRAAIGQSAARLYWFLSKNPSVQSMSAMVSGRIIPRESTGNFPLQEDSFAPNGQLEYNSFYADTDVVRLLMLEEQLKHLDVTDEYIIRGLLNDIGQQELADMLFVSESTLKYRIKKIAENMGCRTKKELLAYLKSFFQSL